MLRPLVERKISFTSSAATTVAALLFFLAATQAAQSQSFQVIHYFSGGTDGAGPVAGLTVDSAGNLYGTTRGGGVGTRNCPVGCGTVFELSPTSSGWSFKTIYTFRGGRDGDLPQARVIIGPDGGLYGTTLDGGGIDCGTVYKLTQSNGNWTESVIHRFGVGFSQDGCAPNGALVFDQSGNLYGTTHYGGTGSFYRGTAFEMSPSGDGWTERVIANVSWPDSGLILDNAGNLYGIDSFCEAYELWPAGYRWNMTMLQGIENNTCGGGLIFDSAGDLLGASFEGGAGSGIIFELSQGDWNFSQLYEFHSVSGNTGPLDSLVIDAAGNLYDTTQELGSYGAGSVFKFSPPYGQGDLVDLHDFTGRSDGGYPWGNVIFGPNGKLYGTTAGGGEPCSGHFGNYGNNGCGVVFEITP